MKSGGSENHDEPVIAAAIALATFILVPVPIATLALYLAPDNWIEPTWRGLRASGAVALGFLGAVHWGLAIADTANVVRVRLAALCWNVMPALLGWTILVLELAGGPTAMLLGVGFSAQFVADRRAQRAGYCPHWYLAMRSWQTVAVLICLLAALLTGAHY